MWNTTQGGPCIFRPVPYDSFESPNSVFREQAHKEPQPEMHMFDMSVDTLRQNASPEVFGSGSQWAMKSNTYPHVQKFLLPWQLP